MRARLYTRRLRPRIGESLAARFKQARHRSTDLEVLKAAIRARLEKMIRLNRSRADFAETFEALIGSYNAGSRIDSLFQELMKLSDSLKAEEQRYVRENTTEEEPIIFDILTRPAPELYRRKCSAVFEHVYESYPGRGADGVVPCSHFAAEARRLRQRLSLSRPDGRSFGRRGVASACCGSLGWTTRGGTTTGARAAGSMTNRGQNGRCCTRAPWTRPTLESRGVAQKAPSSADLRALIECMVNAQPAVYTAVAKGIDLRIEQPDLHATALAGRCIPGPGQADVVFPSPNAATIRP